MSLALLIVSGLSAQTVYNSNGSSCGKIESNGTMRNSSGSSIGKIESNGTVRNASGSSIGKIESDGTIRNGSGSSIGKVESDGTVRNSSGSKIGKVESDGTVRNGGSCLFLLFLLRHQLPFEIPPTTSSFSMLCSVFLTLAFSEPKRQVILRLNERPLFHDC